MGKSKIGNLIQQVNSQLTPTAKAILYAQLEPNVKKKFEILKQAMFEEFRRIPVVEALEYGPGYGDNDFSSIFGAEVSNVLGGSGDLFSFMGFRRRKKPINKIYVALKKIKIKRIGNKSGPILSWVIEDFPSIENIEKITKDDLPWVQGKSWVTWLERGIPGLGRYLNIPFESRKNSRSKYGIQVKQNIRPAGVVKIEWITPFLKRWFEEFEKIADKIT